MCKKTENLRHINKIKETLNLIKSDDHSEVYMIPVNDALLRLRELEKNIK